MRSGKPSRLRSAEAMLIPEVSGMAGWGEKDQRPWASWTVPSCVFVVKSVMLTVPVAPELPESVAVKFKSPEVVKLGADVKVTIDGACPTLVTVRTAGAD